MAKKQKFLNINPWLLAVLVFLSFGWSMVCFASFEPLDVINLLNAERTKNGLTVLKENYLLAEAAKLKAEDMFKNDYFAHISPQRKEPWFFIKEAGYEYKYAGENLASNFSSAEEQHLAWMNSPTHRENILSDKYREVGVAVMTGEINQESYSVTVEIFAQPLYAMADVSLDKGRQTTLKNWEKFFSFPITAWFAKHPSLTVGGAIVLAIMVAGLLCYFCKTLSKNKNLIESENLPKTKDLEKLTEDQTVKRNNQSSSEIFKT